MVKDNLEGNFEIADAELLKNGKKADEIIFTNVYNEPKAEPTPTPDTSTTSPKTNDTSHFGLWLAALFVSGGILSGFVLKKKKEQEAQ